MLTPLFILASLLGFIILLKRTTKKVRMIDGVIQGADIIKALKEASHDK